MFYRNVSVFIYICSVIRIWSKIFKIICSMLVQIRSKADRSRKKPTTNITIACGLNDDNAAFIFACNVNCMDSF